MQKKQVVLKQLAVNAGLVESCENTELNLTERNSSSIEPGMEALGAFRVSFIELPKSIYPRNRNKNTNCIFRHCKKTGNTKLHAAKPGSLGTYFTFELIGSILQQSNLA